jgi:serine/threonine protein kinase
MELSVPNLCSLLVRSRLCSPDEIKAIYQRWLSEAKDAPEDAEQFGKWLAARQYVTEYQANLLKRGHAEGYFLDQYKILERTGRGRMAGVYKAVHSLGQVVAIKVLPPSKAKDPQLFARFQRESRLALLLKHPHVVRAFHVGESGGHNYLVMEYLEGETLDEVLQRRGKLSAVEAVRLIYQALLGLQHIHEQGLVHRDLKPANLMLVQDATPGQPDTTVDATVKILDIGLARTLFDENTSDQKDDPQLTREGAVLGTPDYMAPEQARNARTADIRADIYSLGCVFYHTLTGQPPFPDKSLLNQMIRHASEPPRPLREFNLQLPEGLQKIIDTMLAKEPDQRYPTPERAAQALRIFLAGDRETAAASGEGEQLRSYLQWVDTERTRDYEVRPAASAASPAKTAPGKSAGSGTRLGRSSAPPSSRAEKGKQKVPAGTGARAEETKNVSAAESFDVELVPLPSSPNQATGRGDGFHLNRRDYLMLGTGAGGVLVAVLLGWSLAQLLRRKESPLGPSKHEADKQEKDTEN